MEFKKLTTEDSCIEMNLLGNGGVILKDLAHKCLVGLSRVSMEELYRCYSDTGWNTSYNVKYDVKITVLDTIHSLYLDQVGFIERVNRALDFFPELQHRTVYIGLLNDDLDVTYAYVDVANLIMFFNMHVIAALGDSVVDGLNVCIFHELMHIVADIKKLPQTEKYCSVYAMARMPNDMVDDDEILYVSENGDRKVNADLCRKAVEYNESGKRGYIKYLKSLVDDIDLS